MNEDVEYDYTRRCRRQDGEDGYEIGREYGSLLRRIDRNLFRVGSFVKSGELDKGAFGVSSLPLIEFHDNPMHGKKQIVIWLLQSLGNRIKLSLVTTAVVRLCLARDRADEVAVHSHGEAEHIDRLLDVGSPVAALLI